MNESDVSRNVADYFIVAGLPADHAHQKVLDENSLEVSLKPSHNHEPIVEVTVIFPGLGECVPDYYQLLDTTPTGLSADLNHGSFRAPPAFICFRRGRDLPPLVDIGVHYEGQETPRPGYQLVQFTPNGHTANINNSTSSANFLTYRRAADLAPCNELVITELALIVANKGEEPPHSFVRIDRNLNRSLVGSDVYLCYKRSMSRPEHISFKPVLLDRYPLSDSPSFALEGENVALFCLPMGATIECWPAEAMRTTMTSSFVLTVKNFERVYGSVISFYEDYPEEGLTEGQRQLLKLSNWKSSTDRKIISKKCICLLSKWPFFDAFEKFLFFLHKRMLMGPHDIPVERYVSHFLTQVPFPSPDRPRILVQLSATDVIALYQPQQLPLPRSGASFRLMLSTLGPDNSILLLMLALTEQKVLIHSLRPNVLTAVAEAMMQIIFPFTWQCPYIPLCPVGMCDYLSAPFPFVIGLDTRFFDLYLLPEDVNAVDLDTNTISLCTFAKHISTKLLPKRLFRTLRGTLCQLQEKCQQYSRLAQDLQITSDEALDFEFKLRERESYLESEIQEAFLQFMAGLLSGYRQFLLPIRRAPSIGATDVSNLFDEQAFLRSRDKVYQAFYRLLLPTQLFTKFVEECSFVSDVNQHLAFFDECMERLERPLDGGRLLEVEGALSDTTVFILPPDTTDLPSGKIYEYPVLSRLNHTLFLETPNSLSHGSLDQLTQGVGCLAATPTPASLAKRTKQEIRSAVKIARKYADSPLMWAKCLLATCYSLWYLTLPAMVLESGGALSTLRSGYTILQRMHRLRLHPVDEICYRVMMQLCDVYHQPVLAVKVLFEMRRWGIHLNAVTHGYYNKAVLESEWPQGIASSTQLLWHKLRNVLTAVWLFKQAGKLRSRRNEDSISNLSLDSEIVESTADTVDGEADGEALEAAVAKERESTADPASAQADAGSDELVSGSASMGETAANEQHQQQALTRTRSFSIVKPPPKEGEEGEDKGEENRELGMVREEEEEEPVARPHPLKYTDIRSKFPHLIKTGPAKSLFPAGDASAIQEKNEELVGERKELLEPLPASCESTPQRPPKAAASPAASKINLVPVTQDDPLGALTKEAAVAASSPSQGFRTPIKDKGASDLTHRSMSMSDVLGEPFRTPQNVKPFNSHMARSSTMPLKGELGGSSGELRTTPAGNGYLGSISSLAGSGLKTLAGSKAANIGLRKGKALLSVWSSLSPQASTKEALNTFKSWGSSAATNFSKKYEVMTHSPDLEEDKASQSSTDSRRQSEAHQPLQQPEQPQDSWSTLAEALGSYLWGDNQKVPVPQTQRAADITEQFETLYARANSEEKDDVVSMSVMMTSCSRCRRCGEVLFDEEIMAGWSPEDSNLNTRCLFCQAPTVPSLTITVLDFREHPREEPQPPPTTEDLNPSPPRIEAPPADSEAPPVNNSTPLSDSLAQDEVALADSHVPVADDKSSLPGGRERLSDPNPPADSQSPSGEAQASQVRSSDPLTTPPRQRPRPHIHPPITVPFISPLVLRKEVESVLEKEGDMALTEPSCPDLHPILYWNLLYLFHRIAAPSHLPGLLLDTPSLALDTAPHPSWRGANHTTVKVVTRWDNESLYTDWVPLHTQWRRRNCQVDPRTVHPLMQSIISGVRTNDLFSAVKAIILDRQTRLEREAMSFGSSGDTPTSTRDTPTSTRQVAEPESASRCVSIYRESLFVTLVALGQDNIDLTAFDREYRRAYEKLNLKLLSQTKACDKPPSMSVLFCRKLFRDLRV